MHREYGLTQCRMSERCKGEGASDIESGNLLCGRKRQDFVWENKPRKLIESIKVLIAHKSRQCMSNKKQILSRV